MVTLLLVSVQCPAECCRRAHQGDGQPLRQELRENRRREDGVQCPDNFQGGNIQIFPN